MNRRGFMQRCFAGVAGAVVAFLPGKKTKADNFKAGWLAQQSEANPRNIGGIEKEYPENGLFGKKVIEANKRYWQNLSPTHVCYCHKPHDIRKGGRGLERVMCNYPKCKDYNPGKLKKTNEPNM